MWVIQDDVLLELPDDAPVPPGSVEVEVPRDVREGRRRFRIEEGRLVLGDDEPERTPGLLSEEEVQRLKEALHNGRI